MSNPTERFTIEMLYANDPAYAADELTEREVPNTDYTGSIPPIPGTYDPREDAEYDDWDMMPMCECEIDWKCGLCRAKGIPHSRLDAFGLGPDVDLEAAAAAYQGDVR